MVSLSIYNLFILFFRVFIGFCVAFFLVYFSLCSAHIWKSVCVCFISFHCTHLSCIGREKSSNKEKEERERDSWAGLKLSVMSTWCRKKISKRKFVWLLALVPNRLETKPDGATHLHLFDNVTFTIIKLNDHESAGWIWCHHTFSGCFCLSTVFFCHHGKPHWKIFPYLEVGMITIVILSCTCSWYS